MTPAPDSNFQFSVDLLLKFIRKNFEGSARGHHQALEMVAKANGWKSRAYDFDSWLKDEIIKP